MSHGELRFSRATKAQIAAGTPADGEIVVITDDGYSLVVGDGVTLGGWPLPKSMTILGGKLIGANFNSTADQAISIILPKGVSHWVLQAVQVSNPSISLTTAAGGIYTATSKGGLPIVPAAQAYSALTTNTPNTTGSALGATVVGTALFNVLTVYFSLTTPQGTAATADIHLLIRPLYQ